MYGVKNPGSLSIRGSQEDYWKGLDWASLYSGLDHVFIFVSVMFSIIPVWYLHEPDLSYARTDNGGLARYICKTEWILCQKTAFLARKLAFLARKSAFFNDTFFLSSSFSKELIQCIIIINKE